MSRRARAAAQTVLLAVDGIGYAVARHQWPHSRCVPLVTTFPSTSTTAWLTALTGAAPDVHLVPGMAYRAGGRVVLAIDEGPPDLLARTPAVTSVFERLRHIGVVTTVLPGLVGTVPGPWARALWSGAQVVPDAPHRTTPADPRQVVNDVVAAVGAQLAQGSAFVTAYVDLDTAVHAGGWSDDVTEALSLLDAAAVGWRDNGVATAALSDHGAVPVTPDPAIARRFDAVLASGRCDPLAGGAGRVRWLYHNGTGTVADLLAAVRDAVGDVAWVGTRADAVAAGMFAPVPALLERIGDVIAVATDPRFPVPDPRMVFEHGGATPDELSVPFARW